jgi:hypothetical protein
MRERYSSPELELPLAFPGEGGNAPEGERRESPVPPTGWT